MPEPTADGPGDPAAALYLWLVAITGARRGELCALQVCDIDLDNGVLHIAYTYVVCDGHRVRKDTKTHQDRHLAIDPVTCAMLREHLEMIHCGTVRPAQHCGAPRPWQRRGHDTAALRRPRI